MPEIRMRAKFVSIEHATARGVADRWRSQYERNGVWIAGPRPSERVYTDLCSLGDIPDIAVVATIIGNKSWSYLSCNGCRDYVERAVRIGSDDGEIYCSTCIVEAHSILVDGG